MYREQYSEILGKADRVLSQASESALAQTIRELCRIDAPNSIAIINPAHIELIALQKSNWVAGLLWVLKKQTKEFRKASFPFNTPFFLAVEPFGEIMNAEFQLWESCIDVMDDFPSFQWSTSIEVGKKKNALAGWRATSQERWLGVCDETLNRWTKESLIKEARKHYTQLVKGENPYSEKYPNLHNLIALSLAISKRSKSDNNRLKAKRSKFLDSGWTPYLRALRKWGGKFALDESIKVPNLEEEKIKCSISGRQTETLFPPPPESTLKRSRKKKSITSPIL
jgi:hypothetical protein